MKTVAYLTAEIMLESGIPTYSGGLGGLAGDTARSVSDLSYEEFPYEFVAVSFLYPEGYFTQRIVGGRQQEEYPRWDPGEKGLTLQPEKVTIDMHDRHVEVGAWRYDVHGRKRAVRVYLLDTSELSGCNNSDYDRRITSRIYFGGEYERLLQETVLGIGGVRMLEAVGEDVGLWHLNEGHAAFAVAERLRRGEGIEKVRQGTVYTTHSPVAGHDGFNYGMIHSVFNGTMPHNIRDFAGNDFLNMTTLALNGSGRVNAVSRKHGEVSRRMFNRNIDYVTNGVHHTTWASDAFRGVYDSDLPGWRDDPSLLANAGTIDRRKIRAARETSKKEMTRYLQEKHGITIDPSRPVVTWARRFDGSYFDGQRWSSYKNPELIFRNRGRLKEVLRKNGIQLIFAGKAHPNNEPAKDEMSRVIRYTGELSSEGMPSVFVENYNMETCRYLASGSDVWLNTPRIPLEASGTSGMCAALNGVPQAGTQDGWWLEGFNGRNGGVIGGEQSNDDVDASEIYSLLEGLGPDNTEMSVGAMETGAIFNTHRMVKDYAEKLYR